MDTRNLKASQVMTPPFSRNVEAWLNRMVGFVKTYFHLPKLTVRVNENDPGSYTDGLTIFVGGEFSIFKEVKSAKEALSAVSGVVIHELAHILYTPFDTTERVKRSITEGNLWPKKPEALSHLPSYLKNGGEKERSLFFHLLFNLINILEDGRIEYLVFENLRRFGGFVVGLKTVRRVHWDQMDTVGEMIKEYDECKTDEERHQTAFASTLNMILMLAKYGTLKGVEERHWDHFLLKNIPEASDYINDAVSSVNAMDFFVATNETAACLFDDIFLPYINDLLSQLRDAEEAKKQMEEDMKELMKNLPERMGNSSGSEEQSKATEQAKKDAEEKRPRRPGSGKPKPAEEKEDEQSRSGRSKAKSEPGKGQDDNNSGGENQPESKESISPGDEEKDDGKRSTNTCIERIETNSIWSGDGEGSVEFGTKDESVVNGLDLDAIQRIKDAAERSADVRDYDESLRIPDLDYGDVHKGINIQVVRPEMRPGHAYLQTQYATFSDYIAAGKKAAEIIRPNLMPENKTQWTKNRYFGGRFNASSAYNPNLRHFSRKVSTPKTPTLSIGILIDESGSMCGDKIHVARATAIALYEMCEALEVPFGVFGHSTTGRASVIIRNYCFFGETENDAKYRLLSINAGGANRDGAALKYVAEQLSRQNTDRKLLFIISDGQPAHNGYGGTAAEADIRNVVKTYRGRQVAIVSAAIDQDKERIKGIYGEERFLQIDNINNLPKELLDVIRRVMFY